MNITISYLKIIRQLKIIVISAFIVTTSGYPLSTVPGSFFHLALIIPIFFFVFNKRVFSAKITFLKDYDFVAYLFFISAIFFSFALNANFSFLTTNIKLLVIITFAFLFTKNVSFSEFRRQYLLAAKFIVIVSLFGYVLINYTNLLTSLPVAENVNGVRYYNGLVFFSIKDFGSYTISQGHRNIGVFWEPGLFASFLIIALIFEIGFKKKSSYTNIGLFLIGLLTTLSTFAYLMLIFIAGLKVGKKINKRKAIVGYVFSLILLATVYYNFNEILNYLYIIRPELFGKIVENTNSFVHRIEAPLTNIEIFLNNKFFGAGLGNADDIYVALTKAPQTSTSTYFLAAFGVFGICYTAFFVYGILNFKEINFYNRLIILVAILLTINKEPHAFFSLTYIILFYFLKGNNALIPKV